MKKPILFLLLLLLSGLCRSQTWNHQYTTNALFQADVKLAGDRMFVSSAKNILELDMFGQLVSLRFNSSPLNHNLLITPLIENGQRRFIQASRGITSTSGYKFSLYDPALGDVFETSFTETLASIPNGGPAWVEFPDQSYTVIGKNFARKIRFTDGTGFSVDLEKPVAAGTPVSAVFFNDKYYVVSLEGIFTVFDSDFEVLSSDTLGIQARKIVKHSDGFIVCGNLGTTNNSGRLVGLDESGAPLWTQTIPCLALYDAASSAGGGFICTGVIKPAVDNLIFFIKTTPDGVPLISQTYSKGIGQRILPMSDGSLLIVASSPTDDLRILRTDADGIAPEKEVMFVTGAQWINGDTQVSLGNANVALLTDVFTLSTATLSDSIFVPVVYDAEPWIAGINAAGVPRASYGLYGVNLSDDFESGLIQSPKDMYQRVWTVTREQIKQMRRDFADNGTLDATPPYHILAWPGRGNPHYLRDVFFQDIPPGPELLVAPFVDRNNDGIYNVYDGDYPAIKGHRCAWLAFCDEPAYNEGIGVGVDFMGMIYTLQCDPGSVSGNSIFAEYTLINRSGETYSDFHMAMFEDIDIGCNNDDYIGSIPELNTSYTYNQDTFDEPCLPTGNFGSNIPIHSTTLLNQSMDKFLFYVIGGQVSPAMYRPQTQFEIHNFLNGYWLDGTPLTYGDIGYGGNVPTNFAFPGNPADVNEWSLCTINATYAERNAVISAPPVTLAPNDTLRYLAAYSIHPNAPLPCPDVAAFLKPQIELLQSTYNSGLYEADLYLGGTIFLAAGQSTTLDATLPGATAYLWSTGATTPVISVDTWGTYSVTVTRATGCDIRDEVVVTAPLSQQEVGRVNDWSMYPNPAAGLVNIRWEARAGAGTQIRLFDIRGKQLASFSSVQSPVQMSTAALPSGVYWIELTQEDRRLGGQKLVINR